MYGLMANNARLGPHRRRFFSWFWLALLLTGLCRTAPALDGDLRVHDPSTVVKCKGRYYVFSTGQGIPILSSDDGYTWQRSGKVFDRVPETVHALVPMNDGVLVWAPDITFLNGQYLLYYSISSWGSFTSAVGLVTSPTLDQTDSAYHWTDRGMVVHSVEPQNLNAIDPGILTTPDGGLWLSYGSYHGNIELVQLNPKTGLRIAKDSPAYIVASKSEASDIIYHEGFYYLFVNHNGCCKGKDSTYNIRVGRSKKVTGPYLDRYNVDLKQGGGSLFLAARGTQIGPGHFGLLIEDGVEKFSCHYEADMEKSGKSSFDIRPLLWDGDAWPRAGENPDGNPRQILSKRTGMLVEEVKADGTAATSILLGHSLTLASQRWSLTNAGHGFYKIAGTDGVLAAIPAGPAAPAHVAFAPSTDTDTDADAQLWRIDQLQDGSYRIASKSTQAALTATLGTDEPAELELTPYKGDDTQRWLLEQP